MKKIARYKSIWKLFSLFSLFCIPAFISCSQSIEEFSDETLSSSDIDNHLPMGITVSVSEVEDYINPAYTRTNANSEGENEESSVIKVDTIVEKGLILKRELIAEPLDEVKTRARTDFRSAKFKVVAFKGDFSGDIAGEAEYQINENGVVSLVQGSASPSENGVWFLKEGVYAFVFYSHGNNESPPDHHGDVITLTHGKEVLTAKKENVNVTYRNGAFELSNILFYQKCVKITIEVIGDINANNILESCQAGLYNFPVDNYNYSLRKGGELESSLRNDSWQIKEFKKPDWGSKSTSIELILLPHFVPSERGGLWIEQLRFQGNPTVYRVPVDMHNLYYQSGKHYRYRVTVISENAFMFNGLIWSDSNLVGPDGDYRFGGRDDIGGYYTWSSIATDPCRKVKDFTPGTWRTPTVEDIFGTEGRKAFKAPVKARRDGTGVIGYYFTDPKGAKLFFPYGGYKQITPGGEGNEISKEYGFYWLADEYGYDGKYMYLDNGVITEENWNKQLFKMQVRCVRNR